MDKQNIPPSYLCDKDDDNIISGVEDDMWMGQAPITTPSSSRQHPKQSGVSLQSDQDIIMHLNTIIDKLTGLEGKADDILVRIAKIEKVILMVGGGIEHTPFMGQSPITTPSSLRQHPKQSGVSLQSDQDIIMHLNTIIDKLIGLEGKADEALVRVAKIEKLILMARVGNFSSITK